MRTIVALILGLACAGCGSSDKPDNSRIQTPNDQPLAAPQAVGGGKRAGAGGAPQLGPGSPNNGKPLPKIEIKQP
jgi:hypothetical protein